MLLITLYYCAHIYILLYFFLGRLAISVNCIHKLHNRTLCQKGCSRERYVHVSAWYHPLINRYVSQSNTEQFLFLISHHTPPTLPFLHTHSRQEWVPNLPLQEAAVTELIRWRTSRIRGVENYTSLLDNVLAAEREKLKKRWRQCRNKSVNWRQSCPRLETLLKRSGNCDMQLSAISGFIFIILC